MSTTARTILHFSSSARSSGSASRALSQALVDRVKAHAPERVVVRDRDVGGERAPSHVTEAWIGASFTPEENRTAAQREALKESDGLIDELKGSDVLVIGAAMCA
jgi:FMN-dependent NADH-azoreductase